MGSHQPGELAESVLNVAEAFLPPLRRSPVPDKTGLRTAADVQFDRAKSLETGQRRDFINDIITPISTKANDEARAARMFQNEKGRNIYKSTAEEICSLIALTGRSRPAIRTIVSNLESTSLVVLA